MSTEAEDRVYYARRAVQERDRANCSADRAVAYVHRQLADAYERRARGEAIRLQMTA